MLRGLGRTAAAADMALKAPVTEAPYSWTGCHVGATFGSRFGETNWTAAATPVGAGISDQHSTGLLLGGQAGCDYQLSTWVLGVRGDYAWTNADGTATDILSPAGLTDHTKLDSIASATGRFGYAWGRLLSYATGGGAWTHNRYDTFVTLTNLPFSGNTSETRAGWTIGGGFEYAITNNVSMFWEFDWYDFGTTTNALAIIGGGSQNIAVRETDSVVKVGLNWTFH
jgi:outer membrane immunogenic protein